MCTVEIDMSILHFAAWRMHRDIHMSILHFAAWQMPKTSKV